MGERTEYFRQYYWSHRKKRRAQQRKYMRVWRANQRAWAERILRYPWLAGRLTSPHRRRYMKRYRFERQLWATLDLKLDEEMRWNELNGWLTALSP